MECSMTQVNLFSSAPELLELVALIAQISKANANFSNHHMSAPAVGHLVWGVPVFSLPACWVPPCAVFLFAHMALFPLGSCPIVRILWMVANPHP